MGVGGGEATTTGNDNIHDDMERKKNNASFIE